ncbi:hypothetical protein B0A52_07142 [Exophiala mesophila]|uniref:Uncharacterized protein n=1 Tax=Exophiala mesophila TaxID=212818 RepID=A0A438N0E3_EXOME|nr:hypothetical protein B0A52_07142 [Exophiala mesophila]
MLLMAATTATALPKPDEQPTQFARRHEEDNNKNNNTITSSPTTTDSSSTVHDPVQQLIAIAPKSANCNGATFAAECAASSPEVAAAMIESFAKYGVDTAAEQAALISWMVYESGEFKYNRNHFPEPGRPGQGTRAMLMPNFVGEYAKSIPEIKDQVAAAGTDLDKILATVQSDKYSFGSAAWYYGTKCTTEQKQQVINGGQKGWEEAFITGCVETTVDDSRVAYWKAAREQLGVAV